MKLLNKKYLFKVIIASCVVALIVVGGVVAYINIENSRGEFFSQHTLADPVKLGDETRNGFKENKSKFEAVKDFVISTINKSPDKDRLRLNLENDSYREITDNKKVLESLEFIAEDLEYVEIYASVGEKYSNIKFVRQQGNEMEAEFSIIFMDDPRFKGKQYEDTFTMLDDNWYFYCWAGD